jgi:hypothetical protein
MLEMPVLEMPVLDMTATVAAYGPGRTTEQPLPGSS